MFKEIPYPPPSIAFQRKPLRSDSNDMPSKKEQGERGKSRPINFKSFASRLFYSQA